jgi:urocanate hydratase
MTNTTEDAMKVNGWAYDPAQQAWTAKVGPSRWLIISGDPDDAPGFTPASIA